MRLIRTGLALLAALPLVVLAGGWLGSEAMLHKRWPVRPEAVRAGPPAMAAEGWRLAKLYGCTSCHGQDFRGNLYNDDPHLVRNWAPNLTLAAARYSDAELAQAIRQGVRPGHDPRPGGQALWGMPSATFAPVTDEELAKVLAFLRASPRGGQPTPGDSPGLTARWEMLRGTRSAPQLVALARARPPLDLGPSLARGRHIARTVCSECHGSDLGGDRVEGGPDLRVAAAYDRTAFTHLMRTGEPIGGRDLGIMSQTAREDLKVFSDTEIAALHAYLTARAAALDEAGR